MMRVADIRQALADKYVAGEFVIDKTGAKTVELIGATFIADEPAIFGEPNYDYIARELEWYKSQSRFIKDIPGKTPVIWEQVADKEGKINSNYGWCVFSKENGHQYENVWKELMKNPDSRRASMIYTRPTMHVDAFENGRNDFICTWGTQHFIRDDKLVTHVIMRSNDLIFGFGNDYGFQEWVHKNLAKDLEKIPGDIIWSASSAHIYERHFGRIEKWLESQ